MGKEVPVEYEGPGLFIVVCGMAPILIFLGVPQLDLFNKSGSNLWFGLLILSLCAVPGLLNLALAWIWRENWYKYWEWRATHIVHHFGALGICLLSLLLLPNTLFTQFILLVFGVPCIRIALMAAVAVLAITISIPARLIDLLGNSQPA